MKLAKPVQPKHAPLLGLFLNGYESMRQKMDAPCRRPLLEIAPLAFSKWYYTALASETILSPANILGLDLNSAEEQTEYAYVLRTTPSEETSPAKDISEYHFALYSYSTEAHPLIDDLKALLAYCTPDRAIDAQGFLLPAEKAAVLEQLSLKADYYLEYLMRLAWLHGLLLPLPSIHTRRVQPSEDCKPFFAQTTEDILFQLGESACILAAERFTELMDLEEDIATPDFFYALLENHKDVDQIFINFYNRLDVNIEEIWKTPPDALSAEDKSIVSSFLFTGIMLDKWFLTPMSVFFHFLRPIAFTPIRFFQMVNNLAALILMEHNLGAELFIPPTYYSLTALGQKLFAVPDFHEPDRQKMPRTLPYEQLLSAVEQEVSLRMQERMILMEIVPDILAVKVSPVQDETLWKIIEVSLDMDLHVLCSDLCAAFCLEESADYLLSVPDQNGFPMEYSARGSKRAINKTNGKELQDLFLQTGSKLTLLPAYSKTAAISLEIIEKGKGNPYLIYPRVAKQSQKITEQERLDEIF